MATTENRPYRLLARFYDEVLPSISEMNRHARQQMLGSLIAKVDSVCDLACGSGATAIDFARAGKRVFAVDNSSEFCRIVRSRTREQRLAVQVIRADMRTFRLPQQVWDPLESTCRHASLSIL